MFIELDIVSSSISFCSIAFQEQVCKPNPIVQDEKVELAYPFVIRDLSRVLLGLRNE